MDGAEQAAARNGSTGQTPAGALIQPWGFALIDGHGHGFFKLQDTVLSQPHSAVMERSHSLPCVQSRLAVFPLVDLSPSGLKAKDKGYTFPLSAPLPLFGSPGGKGGDGMGQSKQAEGKTRREKCLQRQSFAQYFCRSKCQKVNQGNNGGKR